MISMIRKNLASLEIRKSLEKTLFSGFKLDRKEINIDFINSIKNGKSVAATNFGFRQNK